MNKKVVLDIHDILNAYGIRKEKWEQYALRFEKKKERGAGFPVPADTADHDARAARAAFRIDSQEPFDTGVAPDQSRVIS